MLVPGDLRYSEDHQWIRIEDDLARLGLTDYAQDALGEVTLVQLVGQGTAVAAGDELGEVEALKAITDLYMPVSATMVEHNTTLEATPDRVNADPYGDGWICLVRPHDMHDVATLLDPGGYRALIGSG